MTALTTVAPAALCPICGQLGSGVAVPEDERITKATYVCPDGHVWSSHWLKENA